ncbi:permease [Pontibacillus salicampi]|uniref:Permease n=1 Tax=Pontibacillus salicampi TaxID=1449801 RepID=A0ABV6LKB0_9BACI
MNKYVLQPLVYMITIIILFLFIIVFFIGDFIPIEKMIRIPTTILDVNTIFLSIFLEAIPFVLLGVFISALIQVFIKEEHLNRFVPSNPILAIVPAVVIGTIFPVCECAIVPIVRRLVKKGMPLHVGFVILVSAPILNPIVYLSTYYAFQSTPFIAHSRMVLALISAIAIGLLVYFFLGKSNQMKEEERHLTLDHHHHQQRSKWKETLYHASDEFFDVGKFLLLGAFVASLVQVFLDRSLLVEVGSGTISGPMAMMGLAYILSLCSEADAFVASSFKTIASPAALIGFLVYGPMIDLKNTILLFAYFKKRFILAFILIVTVVVFWITLLYDYWYL